MNPSGEMTRKKVHGRQNSIKYRAKVKELDSEKTADKVKYRNNEG